MSYARAARLPTTDPTTDGPKQGRCGARGVVVAASIRRRGAGANRPPGHFDFGRASEGDPRGKTGARFIQRCGALAVDAGSFGAADFFTLLKNLGGRDVGPECR